MRTQWFAIAMLAAALVCSPPAMSAETQAPRDAAGTNAAASPRTAVAAKAAASADSPELRAFKQAIRAKYALKEKAFAEHDAETIVTQFYAPDVISVGEGEGIFIGRDQIRPLYQQVVKDNTVKIDSVYTYVSGDAGWDWVDFQVQPAKGDPFTFAMLFLWAKTGGQWMCKGDVFLMGSLRSGKLAAPPAGEAK